MTGNPKHKVLAGPIWFTLHSGECVGILLMNNGYEDKAYIGRGHGHDEKHDTQWILEYGTPFPVDAAKILLRYKDASQ